MEFSILGLDSGPQPNEKYFFPNFEGSPKNSKDTETRLVTKIETLPICAVQDRLRAWRLKVDCFAQFNYI